MAHEEAVTAANTGDQTLEDVVIQRTYGDDFMVTVGKSLFKHPKRIILELGSNEHDEDADVYKVWLHQDEGKVIVEGNGRGMDVEGLTSFVRIGDSVKKEEILSPEGRKRTGKFGVAVLGIRAFWGGVTVESWKEGTHYTVTETFDDADTIEKRLVVSREPCNPEKHGARLTLFDMDLNDETYIDEMNLMRLLRDELPRKLAEIYVNDNLVPRRDLGIPLEYVIDVHDPAAGHVHGTIFLASKKLGDDNGLFTKVNDRAVGGKNEDLIPEQDLKSRIYGVVHVDDLEEYITIDREQFFASAKGRAVRDIIHDVLRQARRDMSAKVKENKIAKCKEVLTDYLPTVEAMMGEFMDGGSPFKVVFSEEHAGKVLYVSESARIVYVNPTSRAFDLATYRPAETRRVLGRLGVMAVAFSKLESEDHEKTEAAVSAFTDLEIGRGRERRRLANILPGQTTPEQERARKSINPNRLYEQRDATARTYPAWMLKRFAEAGLIEPYREKTYLGKDLSALLETLDGKVTLHEGVRHVPVPEGTDEFNFRRTHMARATKEIEKLKKAKKLPKYVKNVSRVRSHPIYTFPKENLGELVHLLAEGTLTDELPVSYQRRFKGKTSVELDPEEDRVGNLIGYELEDVNTEGDEAVLDIVRAYSDNFTQRYVQDLIDKGAINATGVVFNGKEYPLDAVLTAEEIAEHTRKNISAVRQRLRQIGSANKGVPAILAHGLEISSFCYGKQTASVHMTVVDPTIYTTDDDVELVEFGFKSGVMFGNVNNPRMLRKHVNMLYNRLLDHAGEALQTPGDRSAVLDSLGYLPLTNAVATLIQGGLDQADAMQRVAESENIILGHVRV